MTMNGSTTETKDDTQKTPPTPSRGESAVRHLWKRATEAGKEEEAALIAKIANLLKPDIKLAAGLPFKTPDGETKKKVDSAEVDGRSVDLTAMEDRDARDYAAYAAEMDGSAARERHVARLEEEDREMAEIHGRNDGG